MEFLMTYGWAILIILIAIGVLWMLGVFSPSAPEGCVIDPPFSCKDVLIDEAGVSIGLSLAKGFSGSVSSVEINGESCDELFGTGNIEGGEMINVRCVKPDLEKEEAVAIDFEAKSSKPGGFSKPVEGSATGEVRGVSPTQTRDPSMVAAYSFDDGTAKDISGNGNDGTLGGDTDCSVSGKIGSACHFDGVDDYIQVPANPKLDLTDEFTIEVWARKTERLGSVWTLLVSKGPDHNPGTGGYSLSFGYNQDLYLRGYIGGALRTASTYTVDRDWHHLVGTYDGSALRLYVDGQEVRTEDSVSGPIGINTDSLKIGGPSTPIAGSHSLKGDIDEVAIYNRALGPEEIKAHFEVA